MGRARARGRLRVRVAGPRAHEDAVRHGHPADAIGGARSAARQSRVCGGESGGRGNGGGRAVEQGHDQPVEDVGLGGQATLEAEVVA